MSNTTASRRLEPGVAVVDGLAQLDGHHGARPRARGRRRAGSRRARRSSRPGTSRTARAPGTRRGTGPCARRRARASRRPRPSRARRVRRGSAPRRRGRARPARIVLARCVERDVGDRGAARVAHLLRGAHDARGQRLRVEPGDDVGELRLEEHEAERVLECLHFGDRSRGPSLRTIACTRPTVSAS